MIDKDHVVSMSYTLKDDEGKVIDSSAGANPLSYIQGHGMIIPGLENELKGKQKGDKVNVTIAPKDAYGERNDQMVQVVPKDQFQEPSELQVGMQFQVDTDQGPMVLSISEVRDSEVVVDGNHPLAGMTLHFDVEIVDVRAATTEELDHGHVHGPGGHEH